MAIDRGAIARALLGPLGIAAEAARQPHLHGQPDGLPRQLRRDLHVRPGARRAATRRSRLEARGQRAARRTASRSSSRSSFRAAITASRQESELHPEHARHEIGVTLKIDVVPSPDFFDKYVNVGPVRLHRVLLDRHAVSDQFGEIDLREAEDELRASSTSSRTTRGSASDEIDELFDAASAELDRAQGASRSRTASTR